jgi:hypothetical protein
MVFPRASAAIAALLCAFAAAQLLGQRPHPPRPAPVAGAFTSVGGLSPFQNGCAPHAAAGASNFFNTAVEPYVAVDPSNPLHLVGAWQQDRWTDGGANGLVAAASMDGGHTWKTSFAHFSVCSGGAYDRASDPWVAISPDGAVYQIGLAISGVNSGSAAQTAVLVSRSSDGGLTWGEPTTLILSNSSDDKESITADPNDPHYVYAVWDRTALQGVPGWFSRTTDGGASWEPARSIYNSGNGSSSAHQIVVEPDGSLVDVFVLGLSGKAYVAALRSTDHGVTWSSPITIATNQTVGTLDLKTRTGIRSGAGIPSAAVDRTTGIIYVVWSDGRFSGGQRDGIALSMSADGGLSWTTPVQVNQAPNVQAFTPTVAVDGNGRVGVTYYDFRKDTSDPATTLAAGWRVVSTNHGATWTETPVADPFDIRNTPRALGQEFLGDYQGLAGAGDRLLAFYIAANTGNTTNLTSIFAESMERPGDTRSNVRIEVNPQPRAYQVDEKPRKHR